MRKIIKNLAVLATALVVAVSAVPAQVQAAPKATNIITGGWTGYFGALEGWQEGSTGSLSVDGTDFVCTIDGIGYGGIWGCQSSSPMLKVKAGNTYTISCNLASSNIDKWVLIKIANAADDVIDGRWVQLKAGESQKVSFTFTVPKDIKEIKVVYGMGGVQVNASGTWDVDELEPLYGAEVHEDGDALFATVISASDVKCALSTTTIKKLKAGKKKVTVNVNKLADFKQKDVKKYVIQYSKKANFKGAKKVYTTGKAKTIKKLESKKKYYFRVAVVNKNGKVGPWSAKKSVKVK